LDLISQIALLFSSVLIGGILVALLKKKSTLKLLLSFSGGYLLTIIFTHILPETYESIGHYTGYYILLGFLIQLILEYFSKGAEHGHTHIHNMSKTFPFVLFISLSIHAFIEAIPLTKSHEGHFHGEMNLFWGVFFHKIAEGVALATILKSAQLKNTTVWFFVILFGLMSPIGLIFGAYISSAHNVDTDWILAIALGMFLHITTTIIFESNENHKINIVKFIAIIVGVALGILSN